MDDLEKFFDVIRRDFSAGILRDAHLDNLKRLYYKELFYPTAKYFIAHNRKEFPLIVCDQNVKLDILNALERVIRQNSELGELAAKMAFHIHSMPAKPDSRKLNAKVFGKFNSKTGAVKCLSDKGFRLANVFEWWEYKSSYWSADAEEKGLISLWPEDNSEGQEKYWYSINGYYNPADYFNFNVLGIKINS